MNKVLILRPADQAAELQQMLQHRASDQQYQLQTEAASMVAIRGYDDPNHSLTEILSASWDAALMVSVNAATYFEQQAREWASELPMPAARWYAVGPTSARAIKAVVGRPVTCPWRRHNSDSLLALPELQQIAGQRWLLVRGHGGRELLADTLRARGAEVTYLEVYQRQPQAVAPATMERWQQEIRGIMVSSAEQLGYFLAAVPKEALSWLTSCYWVVASSRLADLMPSAIRARAVIADSAASFAMAEAWQQAIMKFKEETDNDN
ncbi:uroporphyrinogen-III synthase [Pseudidiomarina salinarum]|uniref:uroporphyrinogen-III synthase n=1 Tax=Pseudidiomarina salinarum TaxID=435908 RepID=UPI00068E169D|nr:uroporphyrinogen-III synthase [Pseudidiomarina salinarum]RUO69293.1 uroporphyrinogen-III synthase [Pseudidiomarina salinarum]